MITLRIIDTNFNNYFPQKVENLNFKKVHYGGASELSFKLNENPSFQNHKVELFNNIYLYYHSNLIWQGYITEFQRDYTNLNYNLKASGLLIDFKNKRIKKTYILDDIGEFKSWNEKNNKESSEILYGYSQAEGEKGVKISLSQRSYNAEEDGLFEIKIDENIERLKARILLNQPANFTTKLITLDENHNNPNEEIKWENAQKIDEDVIIDIDERAFYEGTEEVGGGTFTKKIYPSDDAEVYNRAAGTNFGSSTQLRIKEYVYLHRIFMKFPTAKIPPNATILSATLKVYKFHPYWGPNADGYRVASNWSEDTITYNNQPGITGSKICTYLGPLPVGWKSMNIFSTFKNWWNGTWANYGLRFRANTTSGILDRFYSKEAISSYRPYIEVKYSIPLIPGEEGYDVEVNKRYLQFRVECTSNQVISTDKYFSQLENLKLLTSDDEINASNILKDLLFNHTQKLDRNTSLIQDCFNFKDIELCESLDGWSVSDAVDLTLSLENTIIKEGSHSIKTIVAANSINKYLLKTLSSTQNLQDKNLFRFWVNSTITGDILKAKFGENLRYQFEPDWSCQYEADQEPPAADPIWTLAGVDYASVADGILTINKIAANECNYKREDVGHNTKGNTLITRMKCTNAAKTTFLILRDGIVGAVMAIYSNKIEDWYDAANSYSIDMTEYRELWLTMKSNFWILYVDGVFALCGETQTSAEKTFRFGMDSSANLGISYWDYVYYYNLGFLRNKRIEKIINITGNIYGFDFTSDDGKWYLSDAVITGGVLDIVASFGSGTRYPDIDWLSDANDNFEIEFDFKFDSVEAGDKRKAIMIYLNGDTHPIYFQVLKVTNKMSIYYDPYTKAEQSYTPDTNWHTTKVRRVGTIYYFSIDGGTEISWDYGTARAINYFKLRYTGVTGDFDNFKYSYKDAWQEQIIDLNNFPIETRDAIKYIQFEVLTNDAFTFYIDWIRSNFELTSAYYRDRTAPLSILENALAYQDYEWTITKDRKVKFFKVDRNKIDYICPIKNLTLEENSVSYFSKIFLVYFDEMMKRQEIELIDEDSKIPFDKEHVIGLGGISDVGAKAIGEAQFEFHKKPRYQVSCSVEDFVFDKNGGRVNPIEIEPNNNVKFLGIANLPIFRIIKTDYADGICRLTLETLEETTPNIIKSVIGVI